MFKEPFIVFGPEDLFNKIRHPLSKEKRPFMFALGFQFDNLLSGCVTLSQQAPCRVSPCRVFRPLIRVGSEAVVVLRYDPLDELFPCELDYENSHCLREAGELLEVPLLDYLVIGKNNWISLLT